MNLRHYAEAALICFDQGADLPHGAKFNQFEGSQTLKYTKVFDERTIPIIYRANLGD
ncbi:MAG: hypothetical protein K9J76_12245 [Polaromonas sp.]|nr:hypothetical protein [Polaromonas sp.]